ncbi:ATP synthase F1 subunit delta [bacterium]|nr:ATP synthase F1 subunit delta [bacterium]
MAKGDSVAHVYAEALLALAFEKGVHAEVKRDLEEIGRILEDEPAAHVFLVTPKIGKAAKREVIDRVFGGRVTEIVQNFLKVMVDKDRAAELPRAIAAFVSGYHERQGELVVSVKSSHPLDDDEREKLRDVLKKRFRKAGINDVILEERTEPALLGGVVLRTGDTVYDGSLRSRLGAIRERMLARRLRAEEVYED